MVLTKSKIFLFCCLAFIVGIGLVSFLPEKIVRQEFLWFGGVMGCFVFVVLLRSKPNKNEGYEGEEPVPRLHSLHSYLFLFILFFFLGIWRFSIGLPGNTPDKIWYYNGETVTVLGVIGNEPDRRERSQKLEVVANKIKNVNDASEKTQLSCEASQLSCVFSREISGKVLVSTNLYPEYKYGDEVVFTCRLEAPEAFQGFQYDRYLARFDIYSVCYYPSFAKATEGGPSTKATEGGSSTKAAEGEALSTPLPSASPLGKGRNIIRETFYSRIFKLKDKLRDKINRGLAEPAASLGRAIILGDKKGIPTEMRENFSRAGLSHIVAISGMHISILSAMVMSLFLGIGLRRKYAFYGATVFLVSYIALIGLPASAMRAGLMGFLVLWALNLGRLNKLTNSLVLAASIMLLINPRLLRDDIGFQLSFLAVLGIAHFYPLLNEWLERRWTSLKTSSVLKGVIGIFGITIAAQVLTLPVIAINFGTISIIAPLANLLVLWSLPVLMAVVLGGLLMSFIIPGLAVLFFLPAGLLLNYIDFVARIMINIPYGYVEVDYIWVGWGIIYYLVLGVFIIYAKRKTRN